MPRPSFVVTSTGIVAFLRTDPTSASVAFVLLGGRTTRPSSSLRDAGFLDYHIFEEQRVVVLVDLTWL